MNVPGLRSAYDEVGGIVYFGRMLDKIRLKARNELPTDYNVGVKEWYDFDARCTRFLGVKYSALKQRVLEGARTRSCCAGASSMDASRAGKKSKSGIPS
jgi:hypothetical protein